MFCYQCEQRASGTGCTKVGVCGKSNETALLQDLLLYAVKGIAMYAHRAGMGMPDDVRKELPHRLEEKDSDFYPFSTNEAGHQNSGTPCW